MATHTEVTPNRRGRRSRELVLDAAERVMAEDGFEAATVARVVKEAGIPLSSVYHYYGSKDGILLAVMERGAERFFADLPDRPAAARTPGGAPGARVLDGRAARWSATRASSGCSSSSPRSRRPRRAARSQAVVAQRPRARARAAASRDRPRVRRRPGAAPSPTSLARFALAAFDGGFVASQADPAFTLERLLEPLAPAIVAARRALIAGRR